MCTYFPLLPLFIEPIHLVYEVIIVDSGSSDKTVEIAHKFDCKILHIKKSEFSFARSLNIGCAAATGDYLLFIFRMKIALW